MVSPIFARAAASAAHADSILPDAAKLLTQYSDEIAVLEGRRVAYPQAPIAEVIAEKQAVIDQTLQPVVDPAAQKAIIEAARKSLVGNDAFSAFDAALQRYGVALR